MAPVLLDPQEKERGETEEFIRIVAWIAMHPRTWAVIAIVGVVYCRWAGHGMPAIPIPGGESAFAAPIFPNGTTLYTEPVYIKPIPSLPIHTSTPTCQGEGCPGYPSPTPWVIKP